MRFTLKGKTVVSHRINGLVLEESLRELAELTDDQMQMHMWVR